MDVSRYVIVQAIINYNKEIIPIWDKRLKFEKSDLYGDVIIFDGEIGTYSKIEEVIFDLKTRSLSVGIELDYYPDINSIGFKIGDLVLYEVSNRNLREVKIVDIVFEEFDMILVRGKKIDKWYRDRFKDIEIDSNSIYVIKEWKPFYILDDGTKVEYDYLLYNKVV